MIEIVSYIGAVCLLLGWAVNKKNRIASDTLNFVGSIAMVVWGACIKAYAIILLDVLYGIISLYFLSKDVKKNGK